MLQATSSWSSATTFELGSIAFPALHACLATPGKKAVRFTAAYVYRLVATTTMKETKVGDRIRTAALFVRTNSTAARRAFAFTVSGLGSLTHRSLHYICRLYHLPGDSVIPVVIGYLKVSLPISLV